MWPGQAVYPSRTLRIEPAQSWQGLNLRELWRYRELLYFFVWRDIKVRYKQTVLGGLWAIIQPVAATLLFTVVFGRLGGLSKQVNGSYALFVYVGLSLWTFYANAVSLAANSLVGSSHLIAKVYFPRLLIPLASILSGLVDFAVAFAFLLVLMVVYRVPPAPQTVVAAILRAGDHGGGSGRRRAVFRAHRELPRLPLRHHVRRAALAVRDARALFDRHHPGHGGASCTRSIRWWAWWRGFAPRCSAARSRSASCSSRSCRRLLLLVVGLRYFTAVERRFADVI